jgi:hypothetical protein
MLVFSTLLCELYVAPLTCSLIQLYTPLPCVKVQHIQTVCGWEWDVGC